MIEVKFTCANAHELKNLLNLLTSGNEEAASAYEAATAPAETTQIIGGIAAVALNEGEPVQEAEEAPTVSLQDLQTLGRKLAAAGKGTAVQTILKAHGAKLLSKIPEAERAAVYAEMQEVE